MNSYGHILGNKEYIEKNYKPANVSWKDYYIWIKAAIDSDIFFSYLSADALGRQDIIQILEFERPDLFSDINEYYQIDPEFGEKILAFQGRHKVFSLWERRPDTEKILGTKKFWMYVVANSFVSDFSSKIMSENKKCLYSMNLEYEEKEYFSPEEFLEKIFENLVPFHVPVTEKIPKEIQIELDEAEKKERDYYLYYVEGVDKLTLQEKVNKAGWTWGNLGRCLGQAVLMAIVFRGVQYMYSNARE